MTDIRKLTLEDVDFLLELERSGIVLKAGRRFNMSPSTASRQFARIRSLFSEPVYKFAGGRWQPTDYFRSIRSDLIDIGQRADNLTTGTFDPATSQRTFTVSCMMAEVTTVIGGVLPKLISRSPKSRLDLMHHNNELGSVMEGRADFAIVTCVNLPPDVHTLRLYPVSRVILLRKDHPLTRLKGRYTSKSLLTYDRVTIVTGRSSSWTSPDQNLFPYEKYMEHTRYSTSRFETAWAAMANTDLICVCGWRAAEIATKMFNLTALPLPADAPPDDLWNVLIWSDQNHKDSAHVWVRSLFAEWAKEEAERIKKLNALGMGPASVQFGKKRRTKTV